DDGRHAQGAAARGRGPTDEGPREADLAGALGLPVPRSGDHRLLDLHAGRAGLRLLPDLPPLEHHRAGEALRRDDELPRHDEGRAVRGVGGQHRLLHRRLDPAVDGHRARSRGAAQPPHPVPQRVPHRLLPAGGHSVHRVGTAVEVALQRRLRPVQLLPAQGPHHRRAVAVAVLAEPRHAGGDPHERVDRRRVQHGGLPGGAAVDPGRALRVGDDRRRGTPASTPLHHRADAATHHPVPAGDRHHRLAAGVHPDLRDDQRRAGQQDDHDGLLHVPLGLQVLRHGLRQHAGVRSLRHAAGFHSLPAAAVPAGGV
ncbi:MAG: ABC transporter, permease protein 1 (cluster 1, maltose/g3p/polyamine/iron), partial [uncultured Nocardioidaceae bacterium]